MLKVVGFDDFNGVDAEGSREGLIWLWKKGFKVEVIHKTLNWIHIELRQVDGSKMLIFGIYGPKKLIERYKLRDFMQSTNRQVNLPWLLIKDFNQVVHMEDKSSANSKLYGADDFRKV